MGLENRLKYFLQKHTEIQKVGERYTVKRSKVSVILPSSFTKEVCRIIGIIHGDGNMSGRRFHVTDQNLEYHRYLQELFEKTFGIKLNIFHDKNRNTFYSYSKNSIVYKYLTEVLEIPAGAVRSKLRIPKFLKELPLELQAEYIGGLFDSESHIRERQAEIDFSTTSKEVWDFVKEFLTKIGIKFSERIRKRRKNPEFEIFIYGKNNLKIFNNFVKLHHPDKIKKIMLFLPH